MSKLLWLIGGTTLALAVFTILNGPNFAPEPADGVDRAAGKLAGWGTKQRATGTGGKLLGKVEEFASKLTGNPDTPTRASSTRPPARSATPPGRPPRPSAAQFTT